MLKPSKKAQRKRNQTQLRRKRLRLALIARCGEVCFACRWSPHSHYTTGSINKTRIELAHIWHGSSHDDLSTNVVLLCNVCHSANHNRRVIAGGEVMPPLEAKHLIWLKSVFDQTFYSLRELASIKGWRELPPEHQPEPVPSYYTAQWQQHREDMEEFLK